MDAFKKILDMHDGSKSALAHRLKELCPDSKISPTHVNNWLTRDFKVPAEWIIPCCETVDFEVKPNELDSKVYPNPNDGLPMHLRAVE